MEASTHEILRKSHEKVLAELKSPGNGRFTVETCPVELSCELTEAVELCEAAWFALSGLEAFDGVPQPEAYAGVKEVIQQAGEAVRRARYSCFPDAFPDDARHARS